MSEQQHDLLGDDSYSADLAEHLDKVPAEVRRKWPKDLAALIDIYASELQHLGVAEAQRDKIALTLLLAQANYGGGRYFYLPKGDRLKAAVRDRQIWQAFNGYNVNELVSQFGLTAQRIYSILNEQRALDVKERQPELF